jgi:type I site-specific restriction endonuclease
LERALTSAIVRANDQEAPGREAAVTPEQRAREAIDRLLAAAGWAVQDFKHADIHAARGVALREFVLDAGQGFADYLLYVSGKACGVIEAKKQGATLTGVEIQSARYAQGLPASLPAWRRPLPFVYESTGVETHFTNGLDPTPRARNVFACSPFALSLSKGPQSRSLAGSMRSPPSSPACSRCPSSSPSGASTNSGWLRSPPSATWRRTSPRTSRAR